MRFANNYLSRSPSQVHFGLGKETQVEKLQVEFAEPDKRKVVIDSPGINSFILFHKLKRVNKYTAEYLLVYDFFNE